VNVASGIHLILFIDMGDHSFVTYLQATASQ